MSTTPNLYNLAIALEGLAMRFNAALTNAPSMLEVNDPWAAFDRVVEHLAAMTRDEYTICGYTERRYLIIDKSTDAAVADCTFSISELLKQAERTATDTTK